MASAYTPGLTVAADLVVRRVRRLPIKGEVLVSPGDPVTPRQVVARALLPGILQTIKLAERLGVEAKDAPGMFRLSPGDRIDKGQIVAESKGFLGFFRQTISSEFEGTVESVSEVTGNVLVREAGIPVDVDAYVRGTIAEVIPQEGAVVETRCAMIQGIFGVGGEREGVLRLAAKAHDLPLMPEDVRDDDLGKILIGGSGVTADALRRVRDVGAIGIVTGGVSDADLIQLLGYDIGVAITGNEDIPFTLVVTEGFGDLPMSERTFALLASLDGRTASVNGATQIRAGVIRPELLVPIEADAAATVQDASAFELKIGSRIRCIREPYFGRLGVVTGLPATLVRLESGTEVRVLKADLDGGERAIVPRANIEIIAG